VNFSGNSPALTIESDSALTKASNSGTARKLAVIAWRTVRPGRSAEIFLAASSSSVTSACRNR
jgi:hypothetical protein